jgi:hypothetical protein
MTESDRAELKQETQARFNEWSRTLFMHGALPILVIGAGVDGTPLLCASDRDAIMCKELATTLLRRILQLIEAGHVVDRRVEFDQ